MQERRRLGLVSSDEALTYRLTSCLSATGWQIDELFTSLHALIVRWHRSGTSALDLVLVDLDLPDAQGLDAFAEVKVRAINVPVVAFIEQRDAPLGIHLLQMGAADYLFKETLSAQLLEHVLLRAWERQRVQNNLSEYLQELYTSESRFRTILQHYPDGLLVLDAEGRILMVNEEGQRLLGFTEEQLIGQPLEDFVRTDMSECVRPVGVPEAPQLRMKVIPCEEDACQLVLLRELTATELRERWES